MPTTYTPDPTATQAPSPAPDGLNSPLISIPNAGEGATVASISQPLKVLADYVAWLKKPRALISSYFQEILAFRNARLLRRFRVDHMGYPYTPTVQWQENFDRWTTGVGMPASDGWVTAISGGTIMVRAPSINAPAAPLFPTIVVAPPPGALLSTAFYRIGSVNATTDDLGLSLRWKAALSEVGAANRTTVYMGITNASATANSIPTNGAWFSKLESETDWTCNVAGAAPLVATSWGPMANTFQDFRIEILGANVADDGVAKVLFYINDSLRRTILKDVTLMSTGGTSLSPLFNARTSTTGGAQVNLFVGVVKYQHNTDVLA